MDAGESRGDDGSRDGITRRVIATKMIATKNAKEYEEHEEILIKMPS